MDKPELQREHQWLARLVGEWTSEMEATMEPGQPVERHTGTESVRSLDGTWITLEGVAAMPDGGARSLMTLGYDPAKGKVVGTFVNSMMTFLWIYEGELDAARDAIVLDTEGPSFTPGGGMSRYRDTITLHGDDHRTLTSSVLGGDGQWSQFMTMHFRRVR